MNLFDWLIVGHLVGDYLFQNGWMAANKMKNWGVLLVHSLVYTASLYLASLFSTRLTLVGVAVVLVSHVLIDKGFLVRFWTRRIQSPPEREMKWLSIMADQSFHVIIIAIVATMTT